MGRVGYPGVMTHGTLSVVTGEPQQCSEVGCTSWAAYRTRTNPAWCDEHITVILKTAGLEPLEPFTKPASWRLTRCLLCGCEAHYRFEYVLDRNAAGEPTCRACHWREWADWARNVQGPWAKSQTVLVDEARAHAAANGYAYLEPLTTPSLPDDPHRVRCTYCGRISAQRLGDISFGCTCQTNPSRPAQTKTVAGTRRRDLLRLSDATALTWWDHDVNDPADLATATLRAFREAHWRCPECGHRFTERVRDMVVHPSCPECATKRKAGDDAEWARLNATPVSAVPELLAAWADEANPSTVMLAGDYTLRRFRCPAGHHPRIAPLTFLRSGCPSCRGIQTRTERLEAVAADPDAHQMNREIASQWHPERNGKLRLETLSPGSRRKVWWRDPDCGHEWQASPTDREKGQRLRCPVCRTILDSLAYHFPDVAAEWSPANPLSAWKVRPSGSTAFTPEWICSTNPDHTWNATLASRSVGSGCPECRESGKSRVELDHYAAAEKVFARAASGRRVEHDAFQRRPRWLVDIVAETENGTQVAIEYDGAYWHADKVELDTAKSHDLLAAGYLVVRLREWPLQPLLVDAPGYLEVTVHPTAPDPGNVLHRVHAWVEQGPGGGRGRGRVASPHRSQPAPG